MQATYYNQSAIAQVAIRISIHYEEHLILRRNQAFNLLILVRGWRHKAALANRNSAPLYALHFW